MGFTRVNLAGGRGLGGSVAPASCPASRTLSLSQKSDTSTAPHHPAWACLPGLPCACALSRVVVVVVVVVVVSVPDMTGTGGGRPPRQSMASDLANLDNRSPLSFSHLVERCDWRAFPRRACLGHAPIGTFVPCLSFALAFGHVRIPALLLLLSTNILDILLIIAETSHHSFPYPQQVPRRSRKNNPPRRHSEPSPPRTNPPRPDAMEARRPV